MCQSRGSLSIAIAIVTILSATVPLPCISVTTIAVVGVSFWLWLGGSLAVAVGVVGHGASFTIIAVIAIGGWCRVGRCPLFEGDAKQKQAHQEKKVEPHAALLGP